MDDGSSDDELPLPKPSSGHTNYAAPLLKRPRGSASTNSSDPAYFSSDDLADASAENYVSPRRKKQHLRNWWEEDTATPMRHDALKRASKRAKDSGVFMSSDSNSSSADDGFSIEPIKAKLKRNVEARARAAHIPSSPPGPKPIPHGDRLVSRVISHCMEHEMEDIDLSHCSLDSISNEAIRPLRNLIRPPKVFTTEGDSFYRPLAPALKIFLSNNLLHTLPTELLHLEHLTVLSIRNNRVSRIPESIGQLKELRELNLAVNQLKYLPWELLSLLGTNGSLEILVYGQNPFLRPLPRKCGTWSFAANAELFPCDAENSEATDKSQDRLLEHWINHIRETLAHRQDPILTQASSQDHTIRVDYQSAKLAVQAPVYVASTPVTYFDFDGSTPRSMPSAPSQLSSNTDLLSASDTPTKNKPTTCRNPSTSLAPSLFESCLRTAYKYVELEGASFSGMPDVLADGLEIARRTLSDGMSTCSVCQQQYIIARAEWIEYWHVPQDYNCFCYDELFLPFLRRACSWTCADQVFEERDSASSSAMK